MIVSDLKISINNDNCFLFLNIKMLWENKKIKYEVFTKKNQRIKYMSKESTHRKTVFHAILKGVFHGLALLTTFNKKN